MSGSFEVIELAFAGGPQKCKHKPDAKQNCHGDHQNKNIHFIPQKLERIMRAELIGMRMAAISGLMMPNNDRVAPIKL